VVEWRVAISRADGLGSTMATSVVDGLDDTCWQCRLPISPLPPTTAILSACCATGDMFRHGSTATCKSSILQFGTAVQTILLDQRQVMEMV
jgi:hypothetical protein